MSGRILIVEDDPDLAGMLVYHVGRAGYSVATAEDGEDALHQIEHDPPEAVLLDLRLPLIDGWQILRKLRGSPLGNARIPVLLVTSDDGEEARIRGFELGADDYIPKPFSPEEVVLRLEGVLRRYRVARSAEVMRLGPISLTRINREVRVGDEEIRLTPTEFALLLALLSSPGRVFTREELLRIAEGDGERETLPRSVDAHVRNVRAKLGEAGSALKTVRGFGYRLAEAPDTPA